MDGCCEPARRERRGLAVVLDDGTRRVVRDASLRAYEEAGFDYEGTRATRSEAAVYRGDGGGAYAGGPSGSGTELVEPLSRAASRP